MLDQLQSLSNTIRQKREALGLNQREFAEFLGMGPSGERTISGWERGEHRPSSSKAELIQSLDVNIPFRDNRRNQTFRFIDLFAGIGGIRLPFQETGGKCVFTSEWDKFSKKTYASNFGELPDGDITTIPASDIPEHDVLLAGFPCQAFSQAGLKQGFNDTRGTMFFEIQRILAAHRPKAFLLENVKQLKGHDCGRTLQTILSTLRGETVPEIPSDIPMSEEARRGLGTKLDYHVDFRVLKANNFGVPQKRERIYIIGFDRGLVPDVDVGAIFDELEQMQSETRLGDVLESNTDVDPKYTISDRLLAGHERRLKEHKAKGNGFGFSLFNTDSPYCNTISARYYKDGSEILIDQTGLGRNPRKLTPRECARIQGFPEEFNVGAVSDAQAYRQFGNSVSVPVIRAIANLMLPHLAEVTATKNGRSSDCG
ncbi:DNA (cytosine-5-)-methyltransferase [Rhodobacterales bacterium 52_120_T64]|nr:DNA (cytosine-5-)-methyltransferase [Rhodobacterales bacterium 52_120_T64]